MGRAPVQQMHNILSTLANNVGDISLTQISGEIVAPLKTARGIIIPFSQLREDQNRDLIGRSADMKRLLEYMRPDRDEFQRKRAVISGISGIGKTSLASHYCSEMNAKGHYDFIDWIVADDASIKAKFLEFIKSRLPLDLDEQMTDDIVIKKGLNWLACKESGKWLLVFDNVESSESIKPYLPTEQGHIIITSIMQNLSIGGCIKINKLNRIESRKVILQSMGKDTGTLSNTDEDVLVKLLDNLDGHPLAIHQAGTFIRNILHGDVVEYYKNYKSKFELLDDANILQETEHRGLFTSCQIALSKLSVNAKLVVVICSCLHPDYIPLEFLKTEKLMDKIDFGIAMAAVLNTGLVEKISEQTQSQQVGFKMHRFCQKIIRSIHCGGQRQHIQQDIMMQCIRLCTIHLDLSSAYPTPPSLPGVTRGIWQVQLDHIYSAYNKRRMSKDLLEYGILCQQLGYLYSINLNFHIAVERYEESVSVLTRALKTRQNLDVATSLDGLGFAYSKEQYEKSETALTEALVVKRKVLGSYENMSCAKTLLELARLYENMSDFVKASEGLLEALRIQEEVLKSRKNIECAQTLFNLGNVYLRSEKSMDAVQAFTESLHIRETIFGDRDMKHAKQLCNLGAVYLTMQDYVKAGKLYTEALLIMEKVEGLDSVTRGFHLCKLARIYKAVKEFSKAEMAYNHVAKIKKIEIFLFPQLSFELQDIYIKTGNYIKALECYIGAFLLDKQMRFSPESDNYRHLDIIYKGIYTHMTAKNCLNEILTIKERWESAESSLFLADLMICFAFNFISTDDYEQAFISFDEAIRLYERNFGKRRNSGCLVALISMSSKCLRKNLLTKAKSCLNDASCIVNENAEDFTLTASSNNGSSAPEPSELDISEIMINESRFLIQLGYGELYNLEYNYEKSIQSYAMALQFSEKAFDGHQDAIRCRILHQLGLLHIRVSDYSSAMDYITQASYLVPALPVNLIHLQAEVVNCKATILYHMEKYDEAAEMYKIAVTNTRYIKNDRRSALRAMFLNNLGRAYEAINEKQKAIKVYRISLEIKDCTEFTKKGIAYAITLENLGKVLKYTGKNEDAEAYCKEAQNIYENYKDIISQYRLENGIQIGDDHNP